MSERRHDFASRERLEEIHESYLAFSRRVLVALAILFLVLIGSLAASAYLITENRKRVQENTRLVARIQTDRARAAKASCERGNRQNRVLVSFVGELSTNPRAVPLAKRSFPRRDCMQAVRETVTQPSRSRR